MQASVISILILWKHGSSRTRANTRATSVVGSGLGTFFSSYMPDKTTIGLAIGYVYLESPAQKAGLRRGDVIVAVNGTTLNKSNYQQYMNALSIMQVEEKHSRSAIGAKMPR